MKFDDEWTEASAEETTFSQRRGTPQGALERCSVHPRSCVASTIDELIHGEGPARDSNAALPANNHRRSPIFNTARMMHRAACPLGFHLHYKLARHKGAIPE